MRKDPLVDYLTKYTPNPIIWLFLLQATAFYIGFGIVDPLTPGTQTLLYSGMSGFVNWVPVIWGLVGLLAIGLEVLGVLLDNKILTRTFSYMQVALWSFACFTYLANGLFLLFTAVALPQLLFWSWNQSVRYDHDRVVAEFHWLRKLTGRS